MIKGLRFMRIGDTMQLFCDSTEETVFKMAERSMVRTGADVKWEDGTRTWIHDVPVWDSEKHDNIWHKDGNRVKTERIRHTEKDGKITKKVVKTFWKAL